MDFRHEWKHRINFSDMLALRSRLRAVMERDKHSIDGKYEVRSLYFDNLEDKALREKIDGVNCREKFRIRYYNGDTGYILLEKKSKLNGLCNKLQTRITVEQAAALTQGDVIGDAPLLSELRMKMTTQGLRARTIVDYIREPFIFPVGNVRVTIDYNIRTGMNCTDFLNPYCVTVPARGAPAILEVKWDEFLPSVIRDVVQVPGTQTSAFSKYAACRVYG